MNGYIPIATTPTGMCDFCYTPGNDEFHGCWARAWIAIEKKRDPAGILDIHPMVRKKQNGKNFDDVTLIFITDTACQRSATVET
jgi:hypothetical protein